jgi:methylated-DNA-[protein]-cysteine S-methyltransferase
MPKKSQLQTTPLFYTFYTSPLGLTGIAGSHLGLKRIVLTSPNETHFIEYLNNTFQCKCLNKPEFFENVVKQLGLYFSGELENFDCQLDLSHGTPFQQKVWLELINIPYGGTISYRTLAEAIDKPKAFRAVGSANGKNPLPLIIPCHRVIQGNGSLGGYTGGLHIKQFLLNHENKN